MNRWELQLLKYEANFGHMKSYQWESLARFANELEIWNNKVNLVSRKDFENLVPNHIIPSMSISLLQLFKNQHVVDVGSGGGFPGIPLAIVCPHSRFTLMEGSAKKSSILEDMVSKLKLDNVSVLNKRSNEYKDTQFDSILGRSVTDVRSFLIDTSHLMHRPAIAHPDAFCAGMYYIKGGDIDKEVEESGIGKYAVVDIGKLIPELGKSTDKRILHIPAKEVREFSRSRRKMIRHVKEMHKASNPDSVHPPRID